MGQYSLMALLSLLSPVASWNRIESFIAEDLNMKRALRKLHTHYCCPVTPNCKISVVMNRRELSVSSKHSKSNPGKTGVSNSMSIHASSQRKAFGWPAFFFFLHRLIFNESVSIADIYLKRGIFTHMNSLCSACLTGTRVVKCTTQRHKRGVLVNAIQECWVFIPTASNQYYTYLQRISIPEPNHYMIKKQTPL